MKLDESEVKWSEAKRPARNEWPNEWSEMNERMNE